MTRGEGYWRSAKDKGEKYYCGHPCFRCGRKLRFVANRRCTHCDNQRIGKQVAPAPIASTVTRDDAIRLNYTRYYGRPCRTCGGMQRYLSNSSCCVCFAKKRDARKVAVEGLNNGPLRLTEVQNQQFLMALWNERRRSCLPKKSPGSYLL